MDNALHAIPSKLSHSIITSNAQARSEDAPRFRTSRVLVPNPFTPSQMISHLLIGNHISISTLRRWSRKPELTSAFRAAITPYIVWDDIARESQGWFQPRHLREDPYAAPQEASRQALGQLADQDRVQFGLIERATALCADEESISLMCGALCGNNLNEACHVFHDLAKAMHQRHGYQGDTGSVVSDVSAKKFDNLLEDINLDAEYFQYYR
ncbi:MAG: hypothetical protein ACXWJZ_13325, partial [Burkholderiaceae bacterium]